MQKHIGIIRKIIFFLSLFFLVWACGDKAEPPKSTPSVVRKSIPKKPEASKPKQVAASTPVAPKKTGKPDSLKPKSKTATDLSKAEPTQKKMMPFEVSLYNPEGKVDPFEPLFTEKPKAVTTVEKQRICIPETPLQKLSLGQLKLVAIIQALGGNTALVEEASGKGYVLKKDIFVGIYCGKVDRIDKDMVIVDEPLLPVDEVEKENIYETDGKNFSVTYAEGIRYININGKRSEAKISVIDGKPYFVDPKELKLQKPPGE
jgi:type IV pilus assembly protein PilP